MNAGRYSPLILAVLATVPGALVLLSAPESPASPQIPTAVAAEPSVAVGVVDPVARHVRALTDDALDGRMTGSEGERLAAEYIGRELERLGARPLAGQKSYLVPFEFSAGAEDAGSTAALVAADGVRTTWNGVERVRALSFSDADRVVGPIVFAGYGLAVPDGQDLAYDSYAGLDVKDKIVLVLRYSPEDAAGDLRAKLARYSGLRYKAMRARELGAKAIVVLTGPRSSSPGETIPMGFDAAIAGSGIVAASISGEIGDRLFAAAGKQVEEEQRLLDDANPHRKGFDLPGLTLELDVRVTRETRTGHNVLAELPATKPLPAGSVKGMIAVGAHYDHLGRGSHGNSLARKEEAGRIHHGADDNASGVAAVLAAAAELVEAPRARAVLLGFWSGEELGLLGSTQFIKSEIVPRNQILAYVNLDMVGRLREERLEAIGTASSSIWPRILEQANVPIGLDLRLSEDPYVPTDSTAFYQAEIPTIYFFTGSHEDYHRPTDVADKINYDGLRRIAALTARVVRRLETLETTPDWVKVERKAGAAGGDRDSLRAYTGTIPDYSAQVEGLRLSGVIGGGPADKAGLREGDVIVEFGGRTIANIYDYTYALDAVKIDLPLRVVFVREGKRTETSVIPTRRP